MNLSRRLTTLAIVAILSLPAGLSLAQDDASPDAETASSTAFASGLGVPATSFDERGNPVSTMAVTEVILDWDGYDDMYAPEAGKQYVLLVVEHTNLTNRPIQIQPFQLQVVDSFGLTAQQGWVSTQEEISQDAISIEPGATGETRTLHIMWNDTAPLLVIFQPTYEQWIVVHLGES